MCGIFVTTLSVEVSVCISSFLCLSVAQCQLMISLCLVLFLCVRALMLFLLSLGAEITGN